MDNLSNRKMQEYGRRLMKSRLRILNNHGFYGLLLMHMHFAIDLECESVSTDGKTIYFSPGFLEKISDSHLDFVMLHEILHIALQHINRGKNLEVERFNMACDIVVNSNILSANHNDKSLIDFGDIEHLTPDGKEGCLFTVEEVYEMISLVQAERKSKGNNSYGKNLSKNKKEQSTKTFKRTGECVIDDHSKWKVTEDDELLRDIWIKRVNDASVAMEVRGNGKGRSVIPLGVQRLLKEIKKSQTNWRVVLNDFVQEEIMDYSFSPPDRRFHDNDFFLPDFNEKEEIIRNVLFMIDTSGSMSVDMITTVYSEVKGAIDQYNGHLKGWLGFFDAMIIEPKEFNDESEFQIIKPIGGGGTDFQVIFEYVNEYMQERIPSVIIIMTDGFAPFPDEEITMGIPVLWLIVNEFVTPPWGKVTRVTI